MQGKIDINGCLHIRRAEKEKKQFCPYDNGSKDNGNENDFNYCGDWCSLFSEPTYDKRLNDKSEYEVQTTIVLCRNTLSFAEFIDERIQDKTKPVAEIELNNEPQQICKKYWKLKSNIKDIQALADTCDRVQLKPDGVDFINYTSQTMDRIIRLLERFMEADIIEIEKEDQGEG